MFLQLWTCKILLFALAEAAIFSSQSHFLNKIIEMKNKHYFYQGHRYGRPSSVLAQLGFNTNSDNNVDVNFDQEKDQDQRPHYQNL